jgi:outer membrane immunogenic protein
MIMKPNLLTGAAVISLFATNAVAADLAPSAPRMYAKAPPMIDPGYNWTGFYAGINGGYSWGRSSATVLSGTPLATNIRQNVDGGLGGGQVGYNWQVDRRWVLGVEADIQGTGERGRSIDQLPTIIIPGAAISGFTNSETSFPWFATFRGRAGFLADPSLLLYATGGLAVGEVEFDTQATGILQALDGRSSPIGAPRIQANPAVSDSKTRVGWTVGAGIEKKFDPHWSAKLEYLYVDLGSDTYFGGTADETRVGFHDHIVRAGINYQFTAGPVVAKY